MAPPEAKAGKTLRSLALPLTIAAVAVAAGIAFDGLLRWIACAALVYVVPDFVGLVGGRVREHIARWAPLAIVALVSALLLYELALGRPPASRDHAVHYFQTAVLLDDILPTGRLSGWTDRFNNGYPFGESYPTLGYLWAGAWHLISFGIVSLRTSYAWGILGAWILAIASVWWLTKLIATEIGGDAARHARWAAAAAALLWLLDPGGSRQGGWNYVMFHGVWPQMLSTALWTWSLVLTWRALQQPSPRRLALAGASLGASIVAHPFGLLTAVTSATGWLIVLLLRPETREATSGRFSAWLIVHALAGIIAVGWVATFFGSAASMGRSPVPWAPLGVLVTDLVRGRLFDDQPAWTGVLAVVGIGVSIWRGRAVTWLVLLMVVALIVLGSHAAITTLRLDLLVSGFKNLQFPRYAIALKPLVFSLGGIGVAVVLAAVARLSSEPSPAHRSRRILAALVLGPLVATALPHAGRLVARPIGALDTLASSPHRDDEAELLAALQTEAAQLGDTSMRVAFFRVGMSGATYPVFSVTDAGADLVLDGHVPTINFDHRFSPRTVHGLSALGVTHVIHDRPIDADADADLRAQLTEVGEYGPFTLQRFEPVEPGHRVLWAARSNAAVELVQLEPQRLVAEVSGVTRRTAITLLRAPHVRWTATFDGHEIDIEQTRIHRGLEAMKLVVPGSGRLVVSYHHSGFETVAAWLSALGWLVAAVALLLPRPLPLADRLHSPAVQRLSFLLLGLSASLAIVWIARRQDRKLQETWHDVITSVRPAREGTPSPDFVRDLVIDDAIAFEGSPQRVCDGLMGKDVLVGCSEAEHAVTKSLLYREPYLFRCLELTVPPQGELDVELGPPGIDVVGMIQRVTPSGSGKHLLWHARARRRPVGRSRRDFHLQGQDFPDGIVLHFYNEGRHPERICVAAAEVQ